MDSTTATSFNTELNDRLLWFDGDITVEPEQISDMLSKGVRVENLTVSDLSPELKQFNRLQDSNRRITVKRDTRPLNTKWDIPSSFLNIDVLDYLLDKLDELKSNLSEQEIKERENRIAHEFILYKRHNLLTFLKVLIYVVYKLDINNVVYGVGRGSSVSSYILYLIGIHDVDSVKYQLEISDFLRT